MNLNSKYFDSIRIAPRKAAEEAARETAGLRRCEWTSCLGSGLYRAPHGRGRETEYRWFCLDHVREYNRTYNFFDGMSDEEVAAYQEANVTGHRPTWRVGVNGLGPDRGFWDRTPPKDDPFELFGDNRKPETGGKDKMPRRPPRNAERFALDALGLDASASLNEIKSRYKELVKRHHPDANGGDRSAEERLRKVIQAYEYLKKSGFC